MRIGIATVLVLGTAAGGLAYTRATVQAADRTAETIVLRKDPDRAAADEDGPRPGEGRRDNALSRALLPVPVTYRLGPDIGEFGNDAYLGPRKAQAVLNSGGLGPSGEGAKVRREVVREMKVQGMAMRSYLNSDDDLEVHMKLLQMKNEKAVENMSTLRAELADALSVFREGPEIKGYENAQCHRLPADDEAQLEMMFCTAFDDDVLVSMNAFGTKPFAKGEAADMLTRQLDRLAASGGEQA